MASYLYECSRCGPWEIRLPIGTAEGGRPCPTCGEPGRRRYTAPMLARTPRRVATARAREEASRDEPKVVTAVPEKARRPARQDPRWSKLPRP
jgi:hypothetical protein